VHTLDPKWGFRVRIHDLRHTFGTTAANAIGLTGAGKLVGHSNPNTTQRYQHAVTEEAVRAGRGAGERVADFFGAER